MMEDFNEQELLEEADTSAQKPLMGDQLPISELMLQNVRRILRALTNLQDFDAFEVYFNLPTKNQLDKQYHTGPLENIWSEEAYTSPESTISKALTRGELRVINLPNSRLQELSDTLKEKAYGQVLCLPIMQEGKPVGMICAAHTRKRFFSNKELDLMSSIADWIANMMEYERRNQGIRTEIIAEERARIGMDLHDGIIQSLYGIGLSLQNAQMDMEHGKKSGIKEIEKAMAALEMAVADIRAYILDLRPRQLRHKNLIDSMERFIREFRVNTMIDVDLHGSAEEVDRLAKPQMDALYHIFQESLSNTAKHARATKVVVKVWRVKGRVMLTVRDNGLGFEEGKPRSRKGHGLDNMQARAESLGGGLEIVSVRKQGTTLTAWMPYITEE